jgi:hypothetical protein
MHYIRIPDETSGDTELEHTGFHRVKDGPSKQQQQQ